MKKTVVIIFLIIIKFYSFGQSNSIYYDNIYPYRSGFSLVTIGGKFGVLDSKFKEIIPPNLESINNYDLSDYFFDGLLYGVMNDSLFLFDTLGNITNKLANKNLYPPIQKEYNYKIDSIIITGYNKLSGNLPNGEIIIPEEYKNIYKGLGEHIIAYKIENIFESDSTGDHERREEITNIYDRKGSIIYSQKGRIYSWFDADIYFIESNNIFSIFNSTFEKIKSQTFKSFIISDSLCWVKTNTGWGLINKKLEFIIEPKFDEICVNFNWIAVKQNEKWGFFSIHGIQITEIVYDGDWTQYTGDDSIIVAYKNDHLLFLDLDGKCIQNCSEPKKIIKYYPNGQLMVEGNFDDYWKVGNWQYYKNDAVNSLWKIIEYYDDKIIYKNFDNSGLIEEQWEEVRNKKNE